MEQALCQILSFTAASALECVKDPSPYGALRLLETLQKLLELAGTYQIIQNEALLSLAERISQEKGSALTDRPRFQSLAEEIALLLVDFT